MGLVSKSRTGKAARPAGQILAVLAAASALPLAAAAQESQTPPAGGNELIVGPPQLKDFSLTPRERIVTQPEPVQVQPEPTAAERPRPQQPTRTPEPAAPRAAPAPAPQQQPQVAAPEPEATPDAPSAVETSPEPVAPPPAAQVPVDAPDAPAEEFGSDGPPWWLIGAGILALGLVGGVLFLRGRRRRTEIAEAVVEAQRETAPPPRPDPVPRPWLELDLQAHRASFTDAEAVVQFVLTVRNTGKSPASNLRIDVKMINAGAEQDKEIGSFFKTAGRKTTKLNLPSIDPGAEGEIRGEVAMPREEMRALALDGRLLFIPVVAVNILYDWGNGRTGQTSKSYLIGREAEQPSEKMGPFRVDQGPRVWRAVGQRPHRLAKRV